ncbi:FHA domain-containing protein [Tumidithrix helvetica PCC 7403]|uniref:FHA domain-containing protein n=1 Tax=Tumidithrix helvetica TaxID=3457545 RepID=UPI003C95A656
MSTYQCSKGHASVESDYCSECGVKIAGSVASAIAGAMPTSNSSSSQVCPDCATPHEIGSGKFCEICGYNFLTGGHGEVPVALTPTPPPSIATVKQAAIASNPVPLTQTPSVNSEASSSEPSKILAWELIVSIDPSLAYADSPPPPRDRASTTFRLEKPSNLIGRTSELRAIHPEIPLDYDDAVSSRHALVNRQPDGSFVLRDIGSSNGTILNGIEIKALVDMPLKSGDRFTLGHWTCIEVKAIR